MPDDHDHLWQVLRSWPPSWRCHYCGEITRQKPCSCPRCCQSPPGACQESPIMQTHSFDADTGI